AVDPLHVASDGALDRRKMRSVTLLHHVAVASVKAGEPGVVGGLQRDRVGLCGHGRVVCLPLFRERISGGLWTNSHYWQTYSYEPALVGKSARVASFRFHADGYPFWRSSTKWRICCRPGSRYWSISRNPAARMTSIS